jgi:hypothetical protein
MAGSIFCHAHNPQSIKSGGAPEGNKNAVRNGLYSKYLSADEQEALALVGEAPGLDGEIEAARVDVIRALKSNEPGAAGKAALVVGRLLQIRRQLEGDQAAGLTQAITQVLVELGLGGEVATND